MATTKETLNGESYTRVPVANPGDAIVTVDPFAPPQDPLNHVTDPSVIRRDVPIIAISGDWTPRGIKSALAAHKAGQFAMSSTLVDDAYGDDRVQATLGSRTGSLFGLPVNHIAAPTDLDMACYLEWSRQWSTVGSACVMAEIKRWAIMMGFCVVELLWDRTVTPWRLTLKPWHPQLVYYRTDLRALFVNTMDGPVMVQPGNGKWLVHAPFGLHRGWIHGAIRAIADKWVIKQLAWRDRARFNERHGLPIIKAYVPAAGDARQKELFVQSMSTLGQEAVVGLPQNIDETGYELELLEARDRTWETFRSTIEDADRAIILTIKSQNLTTEVGGGSYAAARQHGSTEQVTLEFDNSTLSHDLYTQVARPFALFNFGDPDLAPTTSWQVEPLEDKATEAKTMLDASNALTALRAVGVPVDVKLFAKKFGIPIDQNAQQPSKIGTIYKYHLDAGITTINEVRKALGLPPREGGDVPTEPPAVGGDAPDEGGF